MCWTSYAAALPEQPVQRPSSSLGGKEGFRPLSLFHKPQRLLTGQLDKGRPYGRYCSPACSTRAYRQRHREEVLARQRERRQNRMASLTEGA